MLFMLPAVPASAQDIGSLIKRYDQARIPDDPKLGPADRARITTSNYASCLVKASTKRVRSVVDMPAFSPSYYSTMRRLAVSECLDSGQLSFSDSIMRSALYEAYYRHTYADGVPVLGTQAIDYLRDITPDSPFRSAALLLQFADCVVRSDTTGVHVFVMARTASLEEKAALAPLRPKLGPCMPNGLQARFGLSMLKGLFAEALYREASSAAMPAAMQSAGIDQ